MYSTEELGIAVEGCRVMVMVLAILLDMLLPSVSCGLEVPRLFTIEPDEIKPAEQVSTGIRTEKAFEAK